MRWGWFGLAGCLLLALLNEASLYEHYDARVRYFTMCGCTSTFML